MNEGPFQTSRDTYLDPITPGVVCVGSQTECQDLLDDGAAFVMWGKVPEPLDEIDALHLMPTPAEVQTPPSLEFLAELSAARQLALPAPLLGSSSPKTVPPKLVTLIVDLDDRFTDDGKQLPRWPDALVLPQLRGLMFTGSDRSSGAWPKLGVAPRHVPELEFLVSDVDRMGEVVDAIAGFKSVRHLELAAICNFSKLFDVAPAQLEILRIVGSEPDFSFTGITRLRKLEALRLNTIKAEIDCRLLAQLPNLVELDVFNSKRIRNVEALLECPALRRVSFVDCDRPLDEVSRKRFEDHGFDAFVLASG